MPETQVIFNGYRTDFLWRDLGVVFEVDGYTNLLRAVLPSTEIGSRMPRSRALGWIRIM